MKTIKIAMVGLMALLATSCNFDISLGQISGNGKVVTEERSVEGGFNAVRGMAGMDVYLTHGDTEKIVVEADENLMEIIETKIVDGELRIKATQNIGRSKAQKVHVTFTSLNKIEASSGADVIGNSLIKSETLRLSSSSGADLEIDILAKDVYASTSSGADLKVSGTATQLTADASSGSDLKAQELEVKRCKASASSGADIAVHVREQIEGNASSGGDIRYYGNPTAVSVKDGASGSVRKM